MQHVDIGDGDEAGSRVDVEYVRYDPIRTCT
jgi:hypothetical protein